MLRIMQIKHWKQYRRFTASFKTDYKYVVWKDYVVLYKVGKEVVEIYRVVNRYRDITKVFG